MSLVSRLLLVVVLVNVGCSKPAPPLGAPYNAIAVGMTTNQVRGHLGPADQELQPHEVYKPRTGTSEFWYYELPRRPGDFDARYFVVEFDANGRVLNYREDLF